jgi:hypothetical protein
MVSKINKPENISIALCISGTFFLLCLSVLGFKLRDGEGGGGGVKYANK